MQTELIKSETKRMAKYYFLIVMTAIIYILLCSGYTSPLFPGMLNYDSAIFMMIGKGILEGKELYREIFDHKGPILFWIEALGMIGGRTGVFIIQTLFMCINLYLIDKIADMWRRTDKEKWFIRILTLVILAYPFSNGNLSEEYSIPFIYLSLYMFFKDWNEGKEPKIIHSYLYGICFGVLAFIRVNNGITICAIVGCWIIILLWKKEWIKLVKHFLVGMAGIFTIAIPIIIYFGLKGTLYDMLYATFIFNIKYSSKMSFLANFSSLNTIAHMVILFSPLILASFVFAIKCKKEMMLVMEFVLLANIIMLFLGYGYNHYFTTAVPVNTIMLCALFSKNEGIKIPFSSILARCASSIMLIGYTILFIRIIVLNVNDYYIDKWVQQEYQTVESSIDIIPYEERDSILGIDVFAKYYLMGDVLPCYKYGILQKHWSNSDPSIMEQTLEFVDLETPMWLMVPPDYEMKELKDILNDKYEEKIKNQYIEIYRLKDENRN